MNFVSAQGSALGKMNILTTIRPARTGYIDIHLVLIKLPLQGVVFTYKQSTQGVAVGLK